MSFQNRCCFAVPEYEVVHVHHVRRRSISSSQQNAVHNTLQDNVQKDQPKESHAKSDTKFTDNKTLLRLHAFGKPINLNLVRTEGLFSNGGLKIWTVEPNATSQHGLEYVEVPQVGCSVSLVLVLWSNDLNAENVLCPSTKLS